VIVAGLGTGTIAWPMKLMRRLQFEHYWFVGMLVGLVIIPWAVVLLGVSDPWSAYREVGWEPLVKSNLWAVAWGLANVLYGICVLRIGAALTGAILTGLGMAVGVTLPMVLKGTGLFEQAPDITSPAGLTILVGVGVAIAGVVLSTLAGFNRDQVVKKAGTPARTGLSQGGGFLVGLILAVAAGVTSCGIILAFVYSQGPIIKAMEDQGVGKVTAGCSVWAAGLLGGAAVNILYPAWLMTRRRNWAVLGQCWSDLLLAAAIGAQLILAVNLLGYGTLLIGPLGASIGFGIQQATQVLGNQGVGFASGEWRGVTGKPRTQMIASILILVLGAAVLAVAKKITGGNP
jgi:L-rhamnose-H+ transport protein